MPDDTTLKGGERDFRSPTPGERTLNGIYPDPEWPRSRVLTTLKGFYSDLETRHGDTIAPVIKEHLMTANSVVIGGAGQGAEALILRGKNYRNKNALIFAYDLEYYPPSYAGETDTDFHVGPQCDVSQPEFWIRLSEHLRAFTPRGKAELILLTGLPPQIYCKIFEPRMWELIKNVLDFQKGMLIVASADFDFRRACPGALCAYNPNETHYPFSAIYMQNPDTVNYFRNHGIPTYMGYIENEV